MTQPSPIGKHPESVSDPLRSVVPLQLRRRFFPFGFPLDLETNSIDVIEAGAECWGGYSQRFEDGPVRISLGVAPGETVLPSKSTFRSRGHLLSLFADAENFVIADFDQHYAFGWVTEAVARDHALLRFRFLISTASMLLGQLALVPVHAGLIARNGRGVALVGDSFAGKSTLAYACARSGWTYICDDGAMLVRKHFNRYAVGNPQVLHLREDARRLFPELADRLPAKRPSGKIGLEVLTRDLPIATAPGCSIDHVVFLNRNEPGKTRLRHFPSRQALPWLEQVLAYGTTEVRLAQKQCFEKLLSAGVWELCYQDLSAAIGRLERLVDLGT